MKSLGNREIFENNQIYLSKPEEFNDPFDCRPVVRTDYTADEIEEYIRYLINKRLPDEAIDEKKQKTQEIRQRFSNPAELRRLYSWRVSTYGIGFLLPSMRQYP